MVVEACRNPATRPGAIARISDQLGVNRETLRNWVNQVLGRSRGGPTTKIHVLADQYRRPLVLATSPGQRGDGPMLAPLMAALRPPRSVDRPRTRPNQVLGDKAYSSRSNRALLCRRKTKATIAQPRDQRENRRRKGSAGGRPPVFDREAYRGRHAVERCINLLKQNRAVATRCDKRAAIFDGTVQVASTRIWLRDLTGSNCADDGGACNRKGPAEQGLLPCPRGT
ncbi:MULTISPECIES: IS5 family transposase [unclassified Nocardiopsis]|uniref:IS5 family transposase n=1 Tax=unclassified Nocardiopsis TaxID=2649073 RepID=UPI0009FAC7F2|nr:IS5 family transposase [Nocardiopsis sp. TSRI0078]